MALHVLQKFQSTIFFLIGRSPKQVSCIPPDYHTFPKVWLKLDKIVAAVAFLKS